MTAPRTPPGTTAPASALRTPPAEPSTPNYTGTHQCVQRTVNVPRRAARKSTDRPLQGLRGGGVRTGMTHSAGTAPAVQAGSSVGSSVWPVPMRHSGRGATSTATTGRSSGSRASASTGSVGPSTGCLPGTTKAIGVVQPTTAPSGTSPAAVHSPSASTCASSHGRLLVDGPSSPRHPRMHSPMQSQSQVLAQAVPVAGADRTPRCASSGYGISLPVSRSAGTLPEVDLSKNAASDLAGPSKFQAEASAEQVPVSPLAPHNERTEPAADAPRKLRPHLYQNYPTQGLYC